MKRLLPISIFCSLTLLLPVVIVLAADPEPASTSTHPTAYAALRAVQKSLGEKSLERVVEITGREGVPQPYLWRVTLKEPDGIREVEVAGGKVSGQRVAAGKSAPGAGPLHLQELNLDSSGAFDAAEAQARKVRVRFDSINYVLHLGDSGKPIWTLELFNLDGGSIGKMRLAANTGTTASVDGRLAALPASTPATVTNTPAATNPPVIVERRSPPLPPPPATTVVTTEPGSSTTTTTVTADTPNRIVIEEDDDETSGFFTRAGRTIDRTNHNVARTIGQTNETVKRSLRHTGTTIQRFFVRHGDQDEEETQEAPR